MAEAKVRVLIIDDDDDVRDSIRLILETQGYSVDVACDGDEGILLCKSETFDIAIVDLLMPRKEGIETIIELKVAFPDLNILAISGGSNYMQMDYLSLAKKLGATEILLKPFKAFELIDTMEKVAAA